MKKEILISTLVAALTFGVVGCGSSGSSGTKVSEPESNNSNPEQQAQLPKDKYDIRKSERLTISKKEGTQDFTIDLNHKSGVSNDGTIFDIDKGNNGTYEYQIIKLKNDPYALSGFYELNSSHEYEGPKSEKNSYFTHISTNVKDSLKLLNLLENDYFTVKAYDINSTWDPVVPADDIQLLTFDINLARGNKKNISGDSGLSFDIENNATHVSMKLLGNIEEYTEGTKIFVDIDENNNTGYDSEIWKNLGAEYMIEKGGLYHWLENKKEWDYDNIKMLPFVIKSDSIIFNLSKSDFGNPNNIIVGVGVYDKNESYNTLHAIPERNESKEVEVYLLDN